MEAMNRAIEDAADFREMMRKLQERRSDIETAPIARLPGENRKAYRQRLRREQRERVLAK